jgi:hypothetical protein
MHIVATNSIVISQNLLINPKFGNCESALTLKMSCFGYKNFCYRIYMSRTAHFILLACD